MNDRLTEFPTVENTALSQRFTILLYKIQETVLLLSEQGYFFRIDVQVVHSFMLTGS